MAAYDYSQFDPTFASPLEKMLAAAAAEKLRIAVKSGYRSPERQAQLWQEALKKYGSKEAARKWAAPPGKSFHNLGMAADLAYGNDAARAWAHENARQYGLNFPLANENWHIEPLATRPAVALAAAQDAVEGPVRLTAAEAPRKVPAPVEDRLPPDEEIDWASIADTMLGEGSAFGGFGGGGAPAGPAPPQVQLARAAAPLEGIPLDYIIPFMGQGRA